MNKTIHIEITPDHLHLTASQAAAQISQDILHKLPLINRLKCYGHYLFEPAFIKEHLTNIVEDAPFFIGKIFKISNYLSSSLKALESVPPPPTKENLIRIISIPLDHAKKQKIIIANVQYLPPSLQKVFKLLNRQNIELGNLDDESIKYAKQLLENATQVMDMTSSVGAAYGNHSKSTFLALSHLKAGHTKEGFYYGEQACTHLSQGLSLEETLLTCDALLKISPDAQNTEKYGILEIQAHINFMLGEYESALKIYKLLANSELLSTRYEAMRKIARCHERLGKCETAIEKGEAFLSEINDAYFTAKMQRVLGWTYIQLGTTKDIKHALKISGEAKKYFESGDSRDLIYNLARTYNNLGVAHEQLADKTNVSRNKELVEATNNHNKCKRIMHKLGSLRWESASLLNLSIVQRKNDKLENSLKQAVEAIRIKTWICDFDDLPICQYNIAFTHLKTYFANRNLRSINLALNNINQALKSRKKQDSSKRFNPLLCLKVICEITQNAHITETDAIKELLEVSEFTEDDKVPLYHKTLATIYIRQKKDPPCNLTRISEECELPTPQEIHEY